MRKLLALQCRKTFCNAAAAAIFGSALLLSAAVVIFLQNISGTLSGVSDDMLETFRQGQYYNFLVVQMRSRDELEHLYTNQLLTRILNSSSLTVLLSVYISRTVTAEFRQGGFFAAVAKGCRRSSVYLSYLLVMLLFTFLLAVTYLAGFLVSATAAGIPSTEIAPGELAAVLLTQLFMLFSFSVFCTTLSVLLRQTTAAMLTAVSVVLALPSGFMYLRVVQHISFPFEKFWVLSRLSDLTGRMPEMGDYLSAAGLAIGSAAAGLLFLNCIHIKNE